MFSFLRKQRFSRPLSITKNFYAALDEFNTKLASGEKSFRWPALAMARWS